MNFYKKQGSVMKYILLICLAIFGVSCGEKKAEGTKVSTPTQTNFPPRQMIYPLNSYSFSNQVEISPIYPTYYGGQAKSFAISPALPNGLQFSSISGRIAGTPEGESSSKNYTITATNDFGSTSYSLNISVVAQQPFGLRYVSDSIDLLKGTSFITLIPEANSGTRGGAKITSYSISPAILPAGIVFNNTTGIIEGIATETFSNTRYTITGTNSAGSVSTTLDIAVNSFYEKLTSGGKHNCVLKDKEPYCWGDNSFGQLGNGGGSNTALLQKVQGLPQNNINNISLGSEYSCLTNSIFDVYCWGRNQSGQLGTDLVGNKNQATLFSGLDKMSAVYATKNSFGSSGNYQTCGNSLFDDKLLCWGEYDFGNYSLQNYAPKFSISQQEIPSVNNLAQGASSTCFTSGGAVYCFGDNSFGQLGNSSFMGSSSIDAINVTNMSSGVFLLASGNSFSCGVKSNKIFCWGDNNQKQFGATSFLDTSSSTPIETEGLPVGTIMSVEAGKEFACSLINSKVYCWGSNDRGQLGRLSSIGGNSSIPAVVKLQDGTELSSVTSLSLGENHACALSNNKIYCWGDNSSKQISNSTATSFNYAVLVP